MRTLFTLLLLHVSLLALSLDEAIERALQYAPQIHIAKSSIAIAESAEGEAYAAYHPTLSAGFNWQHLDKTTAFSFSPTYKYNLTATYNLFRGFADSATIDARESESKASQYNLKAAEADLKLNVINAYTACIKAQKQLVTQQKELESLNRQYNDTAVRFEQGMVAKNELLLIEVDKLRAEQALFTAKSTIVQSYSHLRQLLGGRLEAGEEVDEFEVNTPQIEAFETLLDQTYANRSELKALKLQQDAILYERKAVMGNYLPHVDLQGDYTRYDEERLMGNNVIQHEDQLSGVVNVSWTLYAGLANIERRKALLEQSKIEAQRLSQLKLDLNHQLRTAYEGFLVAQSAKDVAKRAQISAEENYRITSDRHSYGQVDTLTLLKAQSDLTNATNGYNNAYYDLFVAYKALERIAGE